MKPFLQVVTQQSTPLVFTLKRENNLNQERPLLSLFLVKDTQSGFICFFQTDNDAVSGQ